MADELDEEERAILKKHREAKKAESAKADAEKRAWIRSDAGDEAELPYDKAKGWLQKKFGIDLDGEPVQDEPGDDVPDDDEPAKPRKLPYARRAG